VAAFGLVTTTAVVLPHAGEARLPGRIRPTVADAWLSYGGGDALTNDVELRLRPSSLATEWRVALDGQVLGSPLYFDGTAYVSTEAGSLYALDASTGAARWRDALDAVQSLDDGCGSWGITSTPVIDPRKGTIFAIGGDGLLHALDLVTGAEQPGFPLQLIDRPAVEYVWGGLRIVAGTLYVPVASYCDETGTSDETADGRVIAIDLTSLQMTSLDTVPGPGNLGGVWGYGGVSSDGEYLYTGVGNAFSAAGEDAAYGDHLIQFTPAPGLEVVAANKPPEVPPIGDDDFGAAPVLFQPAGCPPLAAANNKSGYAYVWQRSKIAAGPLVTFGLGDGVAPFIGAPSWSQRLGLLVFAEAKIGDASGAEGLAAFRVARDCRFVEAWRTPTGSGVQTAPLIVGSLVFTGAGTGGLYALDAGSGRIVWHEETADPASAPLAEGDGRVFAPVGASLEAIGDR
jgi:outer membrane protein assembly factor BamB